MHERSEALAVTSEQTGVSSVTMEGFIQVQAKEEFCTHAVGTIEELESKNDVYRYRLLAQRSPLDGTLQRVVLKWLRTTVLYLAHHPRLARHHGGNGMY